MSHRRIHLLEKLQVQLATIASLCVVYFAVAPALDAADPQLPITFVGEAGFARIVLLAGVIWLVAVGCAVVTVAARPEGGILAALLGAAGISLRSPAIRTLLWARKGDLSGVFGRMRLEVAFFVVVVAGVAVVVALVRWAVAWRKPQWLWKSPLTAGDDEESGEQDGAADRVGLLTTLRQGLGFGPTDPTGGKPDKSRGGPMQWALFFGLGMMVALVCLMLLMRSADRGQILFALLASFFLAVLIAHQMFATHCTILAWVLPLVTGVVLYSLAAFTTIDNGSLAWMQVPAYARALPIDYLTVGCGGAVLGHWVSQRVHEMRTVEKRDQEREGKGT